MGEISGLASGEGGICEGITTGSVSFALKCKLQPVECLTLIGTEGNGLMPQENICKVWTSEPQRFVLSPIHQMSGLNRRDERENEFGQPPASTALGLHVTTVATCRMGSANKPQRPAIDFGQWSGREDSNLRPTVPKTVALPGCATPRRGLERGHDTRDPLGDRVMQGAPRGRNGNNRLNGAGSTRPSVHAADAGRRVERFAFYLNSSLSKTAFELRRFAFDFQSEPAASRFARTRVSMKSGSDEKQSAVSEG